MNIKYLDNVAAAKNSLQMWFSSLEQKNKGIEMFSHENELDRNKTVFAKWYYNEGQVFSSFDSFKVLENSYIKMYDLFFKYEALYSKPVKKSLFSNKYKKRKIKLEGLFQSVKKHTFKLIAQISIFEKNLHNSPLFETHSKEEQSIEKSNISAEEPLDFGSFFKTKEKETTIKEVKESESIKKQVELKKPQPIPKEEIFSDKNKHNIPKSNLEPDPKSNTNYLDIDIEEEIRRILS